MPALPERKKDTPAWLLQEQAGEVEGGEGCDPGEDNGIDGCEQGPFPAAGLVADGDEGRYAREVQQDEDHVCQSTGWGYRMLQGIG